MSFQTQEIRIDPSRCGVPGLTALTPRVSGAWLVISHIVLIVKYAHAHVLWSDFQDCVGLINCSIKSCIHKVMPLNIACTEEKNVPK